MKKAPDGDIRGLFFVYVFRSDAGRAAGAVQHRDGAAVLRPAGDVVADRDRALLAVGDGAHAVGCDAARGEVVAHGLTTAGAERVVVLAGAALVGMAFDGEGVARVALQPAGLLVEGRGRGRGQVGRIGLEEDAVANIDDEVLRAARRRGAAGAEARTVGVLVLGSGAEGEGGGDGGGKADGSAAGNECGQHGWTPGNRIMWLGTSRKASQCLINEVST